MISPHDSARSSEVSSFTLSAEKDDLKVTAAIYELGNDCLALLWGGTLPHIGAVGMAQVRPSLRDPEKVSATSSVFTYVGHKEDMIAKPMSEELTRRLGRNTVVVAGIHWDALSDKGIKTITAVCQELTEKIVERLSESPPQPSR